MTSMKVVVTSFLKKKLNIWHIIFASLIVHLALIALSAPYPNYDTHSVQIVGEKILRGINIYPTIAMSRHPYFPLFLYFEAGSLLLSTKLFSQVILLKLLFSLANLAVIYLIYILSKKNILLTLLYAFNPISLLIICFQGQFDSIPVFFILLSIHFLNTKQKIPTLLALSGAIAFKTWPVLFVLPILKKMNRTFPLKKMLVQGALLMSIPFLCTLIYSLLFHANPLFIGKVILSYGGVINVWGLGKGLFLLFGNNKLAFFFFKIFSVAIILLFELKNKEETIYSQLFMALLLFFVITPGFGIQYFFWIIPFALLSRKWGGKEYISILCSIITTYLIFMGLSISQVWADTIYFITWIVLSTSFVELLIYPLLLPLSKTKKVS